MQRCTVSLHGTSDVKVPYQYWREKKGKGKGEGKPPGSAAQSYSNRLLSGIGLKPPGNWRVLASEVFSQMNENWQYLQ